MKMLTIDALGTKSVRRILVNPMQVESICDSNGETRIDTASGETYIVKESVEGGDVHAVAAGAEPRDGDGVHRRHGES